jgi:hypothetical protein
MEVILAQFKVLSQHLPSVRIPGLWAETLTQDFPHKKQKC